VLEKDNSMENKTDATSLDVLRSSATTPSNAPSEREIAARAYEIFLGRGATDGSDLDDWLQAERELAVGIANTTKARAAKA
jgi:Protein of unknown function (DUF2934)